MIEENENTRGATGYAPEYPRININKDSVDYRMGIYKGYSEGYSAAKAKYLFWSLLVAGIVFGSFMYYQIFK